MIKQKQKAILTKALVLAGVFIALALVYLPIIIIIVYSFTVTPQIGQWGGFTLELYRDLFSNTRIWRALGDTVLIGVAAGLLSTLVGTFSALGIHYMTRKNKRSFLITNRAMIVMPAVVMAIALSFFFRAIGTRPIGYFNLIAAHTMVTIPFVILIINPRLAHLNANVYEAGQDLGANHARTLFTVILPQIIPAMIAGFAIAFTLSIDEVIISFFNNGVTIGAVETLSIYIFTHVEQRAIPQVVRALSSLIFITIFIALLVINIVQTHKAKKLKKPITITSLAR